MRFRAMIFPDLATSVCASRIEVSQRHIFDTVSGIEPFHHFLHRQLRFAVRIRRQGTIAFKNRDVLRLAIRSSR
ncbi:hypothetical protein D3C86_1761220 [compost metagenome]